MPLFLVNARDKADSIDLRLANREEHLAWAANYLDKIAMAGPVTLDDGETMAGSILGQGYLAGFGMTIGTVFGRIAGREAATYAN